MNAHILTIADPDYLKRAARIVELYNAHSELHESCTLTKPSATRILAIKGDSGGVLLDHCTFIDGSGDFYRVMFAGFDEQNRGKGYLKACLVTAKQAGIDIRYADLNPFDNTEIWQKVGFKHLGTIGFNLVASAVVEPFIHYGVTMGAKKLTYQPAQQRPQQQEQENVYE